MSESDPFDLANWLEAVADDARMMAARTENINDRHPLATFNLGVEFGLRYAAYEARETGHRMSEDDA